MVLLLSRMKTPLVRHAESKTLLVQVHPVLQEHLVLQEHQVLQHQTTITLELTRKLIMYVTPKSKNPLLNIIKQKMD